MSSRIAQQELTHNEHEALIKEVNELFMAIKISQMDDTGYRIKDAKKRYPLPNAEECDTLHRKLNEVFRTFDKPMRKY